MLMLAAVLFCAALPAVADNGRTISRDELPRQARDLLTAFFGDVEVSRSRSEQALFERTYKVLLADGTTIEFDRDGRWTEIETKRGSVPASVIPQAICDVLDADFGGAGVRSIERKRRGWEVETDGGVELRFDNDYRLVEADY